MRCAGKESSTVSLPVMISDTCRLSSCAIAFRKTLDEDFRCTDITKADIICDDERTPRTKESNAARYDLLHLPIDHSELAEVVTAPTAAVTKQVSFSRRNE
jgi:hypothetical protein